MEWGDGNRVRPHWTDRAPPPRAARARQSGPLARRGGARTFVASSPACCACIISPACVNHSTLALGSARPRGAGAGEYTEQASGVGAQGLTRSRPRQQAADINPQRAWELRDELRELVLRCLLVERDLDKGEVPARARARARKRGRARSAGRTRLGLPRL